jgi:ubiquinone biosynthesis protein
MVGAGATALACFVREAWRRRGSGRDGVLGALGAAFVLLATRLGATLIKVGQIASTRADLLPPAFVAELRTLRDQVPPFPFPEAQAIVEAELGRPLAEVFVEFDPAPVAAASVAQVHRAVLAADGSLVAVKVRRPDILLKARLDRSILVFVGRGLERIVPSLRLVSLVEALESFCDAVEAQIHLRNEARNNLRFTANFAGDGDVRFPRLVPELCGDAVLTMEFIDGVREEDLERGGVDVRRVVEAGMRCVCRMVFMHGFVHSDLHAGNLRFLPPGIVVLLDLGLVGELTDADRLITARTLFALATGDGVTVARLFYENAPHHAVKDYAAYEREIVVYVDSIRSRGLANMQVTLEVGRIFDILRRHRIQARSHMTMVNLALMTAEGIGKRLAPDLSLTDASLPYLAEALGEILPGRA